MDPVNRSLLTREQDASFGSDCAFAKKRNGIFDRLRGAGKRRHMPRPLRRGEEVANGASGPVLVIAHDNVRSGPDLDNCIKATLDEALEKTAGPAVAGPGHDDRPPL